MQYIGLITVDHSHDASGARQLFGELVSGGDNVGTEGARWRGLISFGISAGGVEEASSNVVRSMQHAVSSSDARSAC